MGLPGLQGGGDETPLRVLHSAGGGSGGWEDGDVRRRPVPPPPQTQGSRPPAPHLRGLLLLRPRPGWGPPLPPRAGAPWTGPGGRSSRGYSDGTRSSWWKGKGGCWGPSPGGPPAHFPRGSTPYLRCLLLEGPWGSGPRLWAASFWFRSCKRGMGCWEGGRTGRPSWVPHTAVLGGEPGAFVDSSAQHPGSPVSRQYSWRPQLPGLPAHPPPPRSLSARAVRRVFTPEPAPKPRLSPQQTSSAAGLPGRTQASAVPSAPRDPASPADPWGPGPLTCSCLAFKALWGLPLSPAPTPGSSPSLLSAAPSTRACPAPPVHQAGNTTFSLNVAAAKLCKQGSDPGGLR